MLEDTHRNCLYVSALSLFLRFILTLYGCFHDFNFQLKYTDIDYHVFTDGARFVHEGFSPYLRDTYRYSPLLAWLLVGNVTLHHSFGKIMFSILDVLTGIMMLSLLQGKDNRSSPGSFPNKLILMTTFWFLNPFVMIISSRGSAEAVQSFLVISSLYFLHLDNHILAGVFYGLSVHFKIYPIIFSMPIMLYVTEKPMRKREGKTVTDLSWLSLASSMMKEKTLWMFFLPAGGVFLLLGAILFQMYGFTFLYETYLYHFARADVKHNFSPYFYVLHIIESPWILKLVGVLAFVPQATVVLWLGWKYHTRLPLACMLQVFAFVSLNKVCTSQYFVWYLCLLPLALDYMKIKRYQGFRIFLAWCTAQAIWLSLAYLYEYRQYDILQFVWMASIAFLVVNMWILKALTDFSDLKEKKI